MFTIQHKKIKIKNLFILKQKKKKSSIEELFIKDILYGYV